MTAFLRGASLFLLTLSMVMPAAEAEVSTASAASAASAANDSGDQSGVAPEPTIQYLYVPTAAATNADGRAAQGELRVKAGAPPWWRSGTGHIGSVAGTGYGRIDVDQEALQLPTTLQSAYLNSVSWWRFSQTGSASLIITPSIRTADTSVEWADTRLFVGAFSNWRITDQYTIGVGAISTSNHLETKTIPVASLIAQPTAELTVWFQGIAAQARWKATPAWTFGGSYSLISSLDYQLPDNDPDGDIIIQRDIRVVGTVQWHATRWLACGAVVGGAFRRSWRWQSSGDSSRDNLELSPAPIIGGTITLNFR